MIANTDFCRTRLQVNDSTIHRPFHTLKYILKTDGLRAFYRGLSANLFGSGTSWGTYFFVYDSVKHLMLNYKLSKIHIVDNEPPPSLSSVHHFIAGGISGLCAIFVTNPIWCVKTRLQIQDISSPTAFKNMGDCFIRIYKEEGILQFYRGFGIASVLVVNPALQFTFYELLKLQMQLHHIIVEDENKKNSLVYMGIGGMAKMMSSTITYPLQLIRCRLFQRNADVNKYQGIVDCAIRIARNENIKGFYKGLMFNLLKTVPSSALTFMFYENILRILHSIQ